jgi:ADP-ribose pyrophosphatase YjhB (NUDIX family)
MRKNVPGLPTKIKLGVAVLIRNQSNEILLEKRADCGQWGVPGGRIEPGESIVQAGIREVKEETGLLVEITRLIGVFSEPTADRIIVYPEATVHSIDIFLEARILSGKLTSSQESMGLEFFDVDSLPTDIYPPCRVLLATVAHTVRAPHNDFLIS